MFPTTPIIWEVSDGQRVVLPFGDVLALERIIEAYDGIPFVWQTVDQEERERYQLVLYPRPPERFV